jgi:hypothetical protein
MLKIIFQNNRKDAILFAGKKMPQKEIIQILFELCIAGNPPSQFMI